MPNMSQVFIVRLLRERDQKWNSSIALGFCFVVCKCMIFSVVMWTQLMFHCLMYSYLVPVCCQYFFFVSIYHLASQKYIHIQQTLPTTNQSHTKQQLNSKYKHVLNPAHNLMMPIRNGQKNITHNIFLLSSVCVCVNIKYVNMFLCGKKVSWLSLVSLWQWYITKKNLLSFSLSRHHRHIFIHSLAFIAFSQCIH